MAVMSRIRNMLLAACWALPGPLLVGMFLALVLGPHRYAPYYVRDVFHAIEDNLLLAHGWFYIQVALGVTYGVCRYKSGPVNLRRGVLAATVFWSVAGGPIVLLLLGDPSLLSGGLCGGPPPTWWDEIAVPCIWVLGHIVGGAIAGFHVEYHLLRTHALPAFAANADFND
jgi:hypothetical protein